MSHLFRLTKEVIEDAGDPVYRDKPEETLKILKDFIIQRTIEQQ